MESRLKHLEFIQATINRMANNSFLLKGWSVTVVGGLLAFSFKEMEAQYIFVSLTVLFFFWLLDSYYLALERRYIKLYASVSSREGTSTDFSMDTRQFQKGHHWLTCAFSTTAALFYGGLAVVHLLTFIASCYVT